MSRDKRLLRQRVNVAFVRCTLVLRSFFSSLLNGAQGGGVLHHNSGLTPCFEGIVVPPLMESLSLMEGDAEDEGGVMGAAERWVDEPLKDRDDRSLVGLVVEGRQDAYKVLVERYQGKIFSVAYGLLRNREDAREVTQEAFIKAYRNLSGFRRDSSFYTWIYRITVNLGIDFRRKAYRNREVELDETRIVPEDAHHTGPRPMPTPGASLERRQLGGRIRAAIDELPEDQRTAIVLREIQGLSYKEIADAMDCAEGTVMSRLFYARKKLQELLEDLS
jgi:RNA polymerase sigma-70 factor (ECF subfamily)